MRAVAYRKSLPVYDPASLEDVELPVPTAGPRDLLVRVEAVSVNPVDAKVRVGNDPGGSPKVLGYDAAGVVTAVGGDVTLFDVGDEVYYAGSIARPGTNAQFHVVDERIVGHKPRTLGFAQAAALPLTTITAWETLFDRFRLTSDSQGTLLVLGAAGGVGSMVVQLARALTRLTVVGTASRPESRQWVHRPRRRPRRGPPRPRHERPCCRARRCGLRVLPENRRPDRGVRGAAPARRSITAIDEPEGLELLPLKSKSISFHWELMFTRALYETDDMIAQHDLLDGRLNSSTPAPSARRSPPNSARSRRPRYAVHTK